MARYTKDQLAGFVADPRYRDRKHPEHKAHLDFTVKAFEETYPDPVAPTLEQEEWAAAEEKRLRDLVALPAYRDKRDPDHAKTFADVTRGYDKLNAVLYGTPASDGETTKPVATPMSSIFARPASATTPAPDIFQRANQLAQAGQAPAPYQRPTPTNVEALGRASSEQGDPRKGPGTQVAQETPDGRRSSFQFELGLRPARGGGPLEMPPRVIHHGTDAPWDVEAKWAIYPTQVRPEVIHKLWEFLDNEEENFARYAREEREKGRTSRHWLTGSPTPISDSQLRAEFRQLREETKEFLWEYYYQIEPLFPDEKKRVPPDGPTKDEIEFNPDSYPRA
ncbi:MAG: hypothetical protein NBV67_08705 [Tagaea sp.]|nr:hypothetical protein [Tagaea sp.]